MPVEFNRFREIGENATPRAELLVTKAAVDVAARAAVNAPKWLQHLAAAIQPGPGVLPTERRVNVNSDYGAATEYGARAHWLPKAVIEGELAQWAADHGMPGAEWAIAAHIAANGTPAQPYLTPAVEEVAALSPFSIRAIVGLE